MRAYGYFKKYMGLAFACPTYGVRYRLLRNFAS